MVFSEFCLSPTQAASVALTFPNGRQYRFVPQASPQCVRGQADTAPDIKWVSTSDPKNPTIQLTETGASAFTGSAVIAIDVGNGVTELHTANGDIWDPRRFTVTIEDGSVWNVDQDGGVTKVTDRNANYVEITPGGILHSSGTRVLFTRDDQNRITAITDPLGKAMTYSYVGGDLALYTDRAGYATQFSYGTKHDLRDIQDPLGRRAVRNDYDDNGRLLSTTDALGNAVQYAADLAANRERVTDRLGHVTTFTYNERGDITQKIDANGANWNYTVDLRGNELTNTDPLGNVTTTTYDGADNVLTRTDPLGNLTTNTYDPFRNVTSTTDPLGRTTRYTYDGSGNRESTMDPLGNISRSTYDSEGNLLTQVDPLGSLTRYEYDGAGHISRQYDANIMARSDWFFHPTTFTYDADGNKKTEAVTRTAYNGSGGEVDTTYSYDALGRRTASTKSAPGSQTVTQSRTYTPTGQQETTTDPNGRVTTYHYDALDRLDMMTLPDGTTTSQTYDEENRRASSTDAAGNTTLYAYDAVGRLTRTTFADGTSQSTGYDDAGRAVQTIDALGYVTWTAYDAAGRVSTTTDATGAVTRHECDAAGNQTRVIDALGHATTLTYDDLNRVVATTHADGTSEMTEYDGVGRLTTKLDALGHTTRFGYDRLGAVIQVTDALGHVTQYRYDERGARLAITDANSHINGYAYDFATGVQTVHAFIQDGHQEVDDLDFAGRVMRHTDFMGRRTNFARDPLGRVLSRSYPDGTSVGFTYTPTGQRATMTDTRGTTLYGYDARNRLALLTYPDGRKLAYGYNARGEQTTLTAIIGTQSLTTTTSYDPQGRIQVVTDPLGRTYSATYDATGNRKSLAYPNTTTTTYDYDVNHRLKQLTTLQRAVAQPAVTVQAYAYTIDDAGKRTAIAEGDGTSRKYGYDGVDRLTSEVVTGSLAYTNTFVYDAVGNRATPETQATVGYDTRDRLTFDGVNTYTYDDNGNVRSKSGEATYGWDFDNRLTSATMADGTAVAHVYDAYGNRVQTSVTPNGGTVAITNMLVETSGGLSQVVAETDAGSALTALYVRAGDELLAVMRPGGSGGMWTTHFVHTDGLGSVRAITDESGAVIDTRGYEAFGTKNSEAGNEPLEYGFAGEPLDSTTHLAYHRARWMDSRVGRFAGTDPVQHLRQSNVELPRFCRHSLKRANARRSDR